jgi:hypothetical protein
LEEFLVSHFNHHLQKLQGIEIVDVLGRRVVAEGLMVAGKA